MSARQRMLLIVAALIIVAVVLGYLRPRMMLARYHSEQISEWTAFLSRKIMKLGSNLEHYSEPAQLADALGRIRVEFRYLEMFIGHHSDELVSVTGTFDARTKLGGGFYGMWTSLDESKQTLLQEPPADLQERRLSAAEEIFEIAQRMREVLAEPEDQAYFGVESLSESQIEKVNALLLEAVEEVQRVTADN